MEDLNNKNYSSLYTVYIDGSCDKNPGCVGLWCFIVVKKKKVLKIYSQLNFFKEKVTSIYMEIESLYQAIKYIKTHYKNKVFIYTDCLYVKNTFGGISKTKVYIDKWNEIFALKSNVELFWVKAHNNCVGNLFADNIMKSMLHAYVNQIS